MTQPVRSPCMNICALDEQDICIGCYRSGEEITRWGSYSEQEKQQVMRRVAEREQGAVNFIRIPS